jgi:hypothetical protein
MGSETTTIRVRRETRDRINRIAAARGMSAPDLVGVLVDRAEDEELFAGHATAYETLRTEHPDLLREIEAEDGAWERSDLAVPIDDDA